MSYRRSPRTAARPGSWRCRTCRPAPASGSASRARPSQPRLQSPPGRCSGSRCEGDTIRALREISRPRAQITSSPPRRVACAAGRPSSGRRLRQIAAVATASPLPTLPEAPTTPTPLTGTRPRRRFGIASSTAIKLRLAANGQLSAQAARRRPASSGSLPMHRTRARVRRHWTVAVFACPVSATGPDRREGPETPGRAQKRAPARKPTRRSPPRRAARPSARRDRRTPPRPREFLPLLLAIASAAHRTSRRPNVGVPPNWTVIGRRERGREAAK